MPQYTLYLVSEAVATITVTAESVEAAMESVDTIGLSELCGECSGAAGKGRAHLEVSAESWALDAAEIEGTAIAVSDTPVSLREENRRLRAEVAALRQKTTPNT